MQFDELKFEQLNNLDCTIRNNLIGRDLNIDLLDKDTHHYTTKEPGNICVMDTCKKYIIRFLKQFIFILTKV